jgi:hypothetical protein
MTSGKANAGVSPLAVRQGRTASVEMTGLSGGLVEMTGWGCEAPGGEGQIQGSFTAFRMTASRVDDGGGGWGAKAGTKAKANAGVSPLAARQGRTASVEMTGVGVGRGRDDGFVGGGGAEMRLREKPHDRRGKARADHGAPGSVIRSRPGAPG